VNGTILRFPAFSGPLSPCGRGLGRGGDRHGLEGFPTIEASNCYDSSLSLVPRPPLPNPLPQGERGPEARFARELTQPILGFATLSLVLFMVTATSSQAADEPGIVVKPITADDRAHWAFVPPKKVDPPAVKEAVWVRNMIDSFVLARLEAEGLAHAPEADRPTLLRRLSFDLIGLPPTPEESAAFEADKSSSAYEAQVNRLLASPHYGERQAQHWLDLARYADTDGFEFDEARPDAWRYRDWVVKAFNADMPYNRFVALQVAGDELEPDDPDAVVATGFNRCYPDMVDLNDQGLRRQNALDDVTETASLAFLGLTMGCARCHDHKFDPISQADFYRLQAFFSPARFRDDYPILAPQARATFEADVVAWKQELAKVQARLLEIEAPARAERAPGRPPGIDDPNVIAAWEKEPSERSPEEVTLVFETAAKDKRISAKALVEALEPEARRERTEALGELDRQKKRQPIAPTGRIIDEAGPKAPPTFLRRRGDYYAKGPEVRPAFPAVISAGEAEIHASARSSGRRASLAAWLTRPDHPLTSRVVVNRLWQGHFGRGLVATPSDFGLMGEAPSHPELLDRLAVELVEHGWSLKAMHRLMVTSATYRQSSRRSEVELKADPDNLLLWRHARRRLDGESIRDALLAVSGKLNRNLGGPSVFPELPVELTKLSSKGKAWPVSPRQEDRDRRSLYVFTRRNLRYPFFEAFDRPDTNASCPKRAVTTIAPQALSLLNGKLALDSSKALADRVAREAGGETSARVDRAYRLTLGRSPDPDEARLAEAFLREGGDSLTDFCLALLNVNEFVYVD
jgi:Protein of unknown function (DUF1553)/Protein of unknown function (DUF1549)